MWASTWVMFETGDEYEMSWALKDQGLEPLCEWMEGCAARAGGGVWLSW